ncbi:hypothetical protein A3Q56_06047 [Intoshia linei]|uniref:C2H2-type domain-containing protein n=1 Tax=Intoshia linei TaxID=1819745 RepID=A0A177AYH3_9BILA|nr:hypothetical protein A3Q56_06047 [Intoshia linei]
METGEQRGCCITMPHICVSKETDLIILPNQDYICTNLIIHCVIFRIHKMNESLKSAILQMCADNLPFSDKLDIMGILALTTDDQVHYIEFNNTLINPDVKINQNGNEQATKQKNKRKVGTPVKWSTIKAVKNVTTSKCGPLQTSIKQNGVLIDLSNSTVSNLLTTFTHDFPTSKLNGSFVQSQPKRRRMTEEQLNQEEVGEYLGEGLEIDSKIPCHICKVNICVNEYFKHCILVHNSYICHSCTKKFTTKSSLLRHRPIHTGLRRFACKVCKKNFYRRDKCKTHIKRHIPLHLRESISTDAFNSIGIVNVTKLTSVDGHEFFNISFKHKDMDCPCSVKTEQNLSTLDINMMNLPQPNIYSDCNSNTHNHINANSQNSDIEKNGNKICVKSNVNGDDFNDTQIKIPNVELGIDI